MSKHMDNIENYGLSVNDLDVSPFESMDMLHLRSKIEKVLSELTNEEIAKLFQYDLKCRECEDMAEHISEIYSFSMSTEPTSQWWWYLDKVVSGEISFHLSTQDNLVI